jgi:hypothetical protein
LKLVVDAGAGFRLRFGFSLAMVTSELRGEMPVAIPGMVEGWN